MEDKTHQQLALEACKAGVKLVQLRLKDMEKSEMLTIALGTKTICDYFNVTFIINDHLEIAQEVDADGVHLGNEDIDHEIARKELGKDKIIGATAYTEKEVIFHQSREFADYIGLGTYRKTRTKPEIKEFVTLEQIRKMIGKLKLSNRYRIPLLVIGGIRMDDIPLLLSAGVYGIAIASLLNHSPDKSHTMNEINKRFNLKSYPYLT